MSPLRSLKGLTLTFLALFLAATILTGLALYISNTASIERLVDKRIATVSTLVAPPGTDVSRTEIERRIDLLSSERDTGDIGFLLADAAGHRLAGNVSPSRLLPAGYMNLGATDGIEGLSHGRAYTRQIAGNLYLSTIAETEPFDRYREERLRAYLIGFGSIIVIVVAGLISFGRIVRGRILAMRRTVDAIIDGDMRQRVPVDYSGSEFDQQAIAFNRMLDRIEGLMEGLGTISNEIAHDLRTPLARLRSRLSLLAQREDAGALRSEIGAAIEQNDEILQMFESVLRIAEVEGGARRAAFEPLDIRALAADMVATMEPVAAESGHRVRLVEGASLQLSADRQLLNRALMNLIDNALRHTPKGTEIVVEVGTDGAAAFLRVSDNGPGIPAAKRGLALRRFGRLDKSRGAGGHGLGLPLVEAVAHLHRGTIALEDADPGLSVVLRIPLAQSPSA
ncbi:MAG: two-component sensor histidine kinase [Sphingomonadales bacterium]|nr:two-component sensor histidine kinase [Sphingomonadales bacterium]